MIATLDWLSFWLKGEEGPTALNDQLCSRPDVLAAKGANPSADSDDTTSASTSAKRPWYWLDCTPAGITKARADRESMYARWRQMHTDWQKTQAEEVKNPKPTTKLIEVPEDFDESQLPKPSVH